MSTIRKAAQVAWAVLFWVLLVSWRRPLCWRL
jgi:hypothetical protein